MGDHGSAGGGARGERASRHLLLTRIVMEADALDGDARERFLVGACGGDAALLRDARTVLEGGTTDATAAAARAPQHIGPYRLLREIGSGGMGVVHEALREGGEHRAGDDLGVAPGTRVALKVIHPHLLGIGRTEERFAREAAAGASVDHPNVVRTFGVVRAADESGTVRTAIAMEFVEGRTLRDLLAGLGQAPESLVREIGRGVAAGAAAIHAEGLVHRDLKPENVLLTSDGGVRIMDLGVALVAGAGGRGAQRLTREGEFVGSIDYAAPEQCTDADVGPPADLYAIGVLLHELASGVNPFTRESPLATIAAHASLVPPDLASLAPPATATSPFLAAVVRRLLAKNPAARIESAAALAQILTDGEQGPWWRAQTDRGPQRAALVPVARSLALHGREREIAALRTALDEVRGGRPAAVLVTADAGHGKSRLLDAFHCSIAPGDVRFLYGAMQTTGGPSGLTDAVLAAVTGAAGDTSADGSDPVAAWLAARAGMSASLAAHVAAYLRREPPPAGAPALDADAGEASLRRILGVLAADAPLVLAVDDVQFARGGTAALLAALVRRPPEGRVLVLLASRPGPEIEWTADLVARGALRPLPLSRLAAGDVESILRDALGDEDLAARAARRIVAKSGGVPLYVASILGTLRERLAGVPPERRRAVIDDVEAPMALREVLARRLADLDPAERELLDLCAVQGERFDPDVAAAALGAPLVRVLQRLAAMERRTGIVRADVRAFRFDHQLLQEEVVATMPERLREELHLATGRAMAAMGRASPESLARHFVRGSEPALALPHLIVALDALVLRDERAAALDLAERALAVPALLEPALRAEVLVRMADILDVAGRRDEQGAAARAAVVAAREARDLVLAGRAYHAVGMHLAMTGGDRASLPRFRAAIRLARRAGDNILESRASSAAGPSLARTGRVPEARRRLARARELAIAARDSAAEQTACLALASLELSLGDHEAARPALLRVLELGRGARSHRMDGHAEWGLGVADIYAGEWESARSRFLRCREIGREIGARALELNALGNLAVCLQAEGRWVEALEALLSARRLIEEIGERTALCVLLLNTTMGYATLGDAAGAAASLAEAERVARSAGFRQAEAKVLLFRGDAKYTVGDLAGAAADFRAAAAMFDEIEGPSARVEASLCLASVLRDTGDIPGAIAAADEAVALAAASGGPLVRVSAAAARAALPGGDADSARALASAANRSASHGVRMRVHLDLHRATGDLGDLIEARRLLSEALARLPVERRAAALRPHLHRGIADACAAAGLPPP